MTCRHLYAYIALLFVSLNIQIAFAACNSYKKSDPLCGPNCMIMVCHRLGVESNLEEMKTLCGYNEKSGTTMLGMINAAKAKGLQAVGMKISIEELSSLGIPAIAHLWGSHFAVVEPGDAENIMVTNPPDTPQVIKKEEIKKKYSGFALLIAKDSSAFPISEPNGPDLRLDNYTWDIGSIYEGDLTNYTLKCRNVGTMDLSIDKVDVSCDCLIVQDYPRSIASGSEGEIKLMLNSNGQQRGLDKQLIISSNDPISPNIVMDVVGYIKSNKLLTSPRTIDFLSPRRTDNPSRDVYIPSISDDPVEITSVSSDSPFVDATFEKTTDTQRPGYIVTAVLKPSAPIGEFKTDLIINSNHPKQPKAEIPVVAKIKGDIDLDCDMFFLGLVKKGNEAKSTITISTAGKDILKIKKIDCSLKYASVDIATKTSDKQYLLTTTLKPDAPIGNIRGEVTIHTNNADQPEIKVPVYAYVENE